MIANKIIPSKKGEEWKRMLKIAEDKEIYLGYKAQKREKRRGNQGNELFKQADNTTAYQRSRHIIISAEIQARLYQSIQNVFRIVATFR